MSISSKYHFIAQIEIIGVNPFVHIPNRVLDVVFEQSGKNKGAIPVKMKIDGHVFTQTLVKYAGHWRLYLNMPMRKAAGKDVGDTALFEIQYNPTPKKIFFHSKLKLAIEENLEAKKKFNQLPPSLQKEIVRYIANLKTEVSIDKNVNKAIQFLLGKGRFVGRDLP